MTLKRSLPGLVCLALIACAPPTQFLKKSYAPSQLENKRLIVYPVFAGQIEVMNQEDFADDFEEVKEDPGEFLRKEINDNAGRYFVSGFKNILVDNLGDSALESLTPANSDKVAEKINKDEFEIRIPKEKYLDGKNLKPKFVLVMDQVIFSRNLETSQMTMVGGAPSANVGGSAAVGTAPATMTTSKKSIAMGMNYVIYDYEEKTVVGYGSAKGEKTFSFAMTRSDWYRAMDDAFSKIKQFSPFK